MTLCTPINALMLTSGKNSARADSRFFSAASTRQRLAVMSARREIRSIRTSPGRAPSTDRQRPRLPTAAARSLERPTSAASATTRSVADPSRIAICSRTAAKRRVGAMRFVLGSEIRTDPRDGDGVLALDGAFTLARHARCGSDRPASRSTYRRRNSPASAPRHCAPPVRRALHRSRLRPHRAACPTNRRCSSPATRGPPGCTKRNPSNCGGNSPLSLSLWREKSPLACRCAPAAALATCTDRRADSKRACAPASVGEDAVAMSISRSSVGSWYCFHHCADGHAAAPSGASDNGASCGSTTGLGFGGNPAHPPSATNHTIAGPSRRALGDAARPRRLTEGAPPSAPTPAPPVSCPGVSAARSTAAAPHPRDP